MNFELSHIDKYFADFICREAGDTSPVLKLVVSLASNAVGNGNICLDLGDYAGSVVRVDGEEKCLPSMEELRGYLQSLPVVGQPGDFRPLVLDGNGRLYLYRYWNYEQELARVILDKAAGRCTGIEETVLSDGLRRLFPGKSGDETDWQKVAAVASVRKRFTVISGGPGTGKTSTVVKIIALLIEQAKDSPLRIALAAPTGKAAARLKESIRLLKEKLDCAEDVKDRIPDEVTTIHRLLGAIGNSIRFRFSKENPLPFDAVVIDEASMVALPLMSKLATALKPEAKLILLGDRDQLSSVEAGAVLGDICGGSRLEPYSHRFAVFVEKVAKETILNGAPETSLPPLQDSLVVLKMNYRFDENSGIGEVSRAINAGEGYDAVSLLQGDRCKDIAWRSFPKATDMKKSLVCKVVDGYGRYLAAQSPAEALASFDSFRILCALRQGIHGVAGINSLVEEILAEKGLIDPRSRWYPGRPVMITANDYGLKLFNGDVGIVLPDPESDWHPRVFFAAPDGGVRSLSPLRLPTHETVYAMTVHKSQGSEFSQVLLLLPDSDSQVLTRELVYTGITRAKANVDIWGSKDLFLTAVSRRIVRKSGLKDALWPGDAKQ
jgi:exodeoxyribonuclease V alpha subunit